MSNEVKIVEKKSKVSLTGKFFTVYVNGQRVFLSVNKKDAEAYAKKILEKKVYRS